MDTNLSVIVIGVIFIITIATTIGLTVERDARARAWRRIAEERRWNWEQHPMPSKDPNTTEPRDHTPTRTETHA